MENRMVTLSPFIENLNKEGYFVLENVFHPELMEETKSRMYSVQNKIHDSIGVKRLNDAGEKGVLRLMMKYDPFFLSFLECEEIISIVDSTLSNTAILHLQNGFILPSYQKNESPVIFQNTYHRDFRRVLNKYLCSINILVAVDDFTETNGATLVVPGTHQRAGEIDIAYCEKNNRSVKCPSGSIVVFDSTLWHAAGQNTSGKDRLAINHQFTRSYFKQQIDYVRALNVENLDIPERTKQLLGFYTRVPSSLEEYYKPQSERLYRAGQG